MGDVLAPNVDNYVRGGAQILFKREGSPGGYTELGNIPDFSLANTATYLDHKTSQSGIVLIDRREQIEGGLQFKMGTDEFNAANLALITNSTDPAAFTQSSGTAATASIANPVLGDKYDLGAFRVTNVLVKRAGTITLALGTDYSLEPDAGLIRLLPGGAALVDDTIAITYDKPAISGESVSPQSKAGLLRGAILIYLRTSDGKMWRYKHTKASLAYEAELSLTGTEFAKAAGTVTIERDATQADVFGTLVQLPAA